MEFPLNVETGQAHWVLTRADSITLYRTVLSVELLRRALRRVDTRELIEVGDQAR